MPESKRLSSPSSRVGVYHGGTRQLEGILEVIPGLLCRRPVSRHEFVSPRPVPHGQSSTGNRVKRQFIDPATGEPVEAEDQVKGYEVGQRLVRLCRGRGLEAIKIESTHTIDIETFVPRDQVDQRYLEAPYYIAPEDKVAQEAFAVIRDAMREKGKAGVARVVISRRERMILLEPLGKGLLGTLLRYPYEVRAEDAYFEDIPDLSCPRNARPRGPYHRAEDDRLRPLKIRRSL